AGRVIPHRQAPMMFTAILAAGLGLAACSALPPLVNDQAEPEPLYGGIVAQSFRATFPSSSGFGRIEISGLRRVFYTKGWSWLACVQFETDGRRRVYAFYIQQDRVIESRYAVQIDQCGAQQYVPFDLATGAFIPSAPSEPAPLY